MSAALFITIMLCVLQDYIQYDLPTKLKSNLTVGKTNG